MSDDELRAAGAQLLARGEPTHPQQDDDGNWFDVPCDCPPALEPHHRAGRQPTDAERAVLADLRERALTAQRKAEARTATEMPRAGSRSRAGTDRESFRAQNHITPSRRLETP